MEELDQRIRRLDLDGFVAGWDPPPTTTSSRRTSDAGGGRGWRRWASQRWGATEEASARGVLREVRAVLAHRGPRAESGMGRPVRSGRRRGSGPNHRIARPTPAGAAPVG